MADAWGKRAADDMRLRLKALAESRAASKQGAMQ